VGILKTGISAIGKLFIVAALAGTFIVGMVSVVYLSLSGEEVKVPEIVGKNYLDSEKELAGLGLKVKRRALRYSTEKPNTILEQLPRSGETVKTGQTILVVLSQANPEGEEAPVTIEKNKEEEAETAPELEIPSDKKKTTNKNANVKKATTTRDVEKTNSNSNTATNSNSSNSNQSGTKAANTATPTAPANKPNTTATPAAKPATPASSPKPNVTTPKPVAAKTPVSSGDVRSRRVN
jgi:beta-lactam-binding protein with PASTA domain